jgi:hypothetical protein
MTAAAFLIKNPTNNPVGATPTLIGAGYQQPGDSACIMLWNGEYGVYRWKVISEKDGSARLDPHFEKQGVWGKP